MGARMGTQKFLPQSGSNGSGVDRYRLPTAGVRQPCPHPDCARLQAAAPIIPACQAQISVVTGELSCQLDRRAGDMGLAVSCPQWPFNMAHLVLLTYMIAHITGWKPGNLEKSMNDL
ncbi:hypothetical protein GH733_013290 [Mirounga leonina]|nr:hypothetical protein GH733_013290 [Mirounga leonina]